MSKNNSVVPISKNECCGCGICEKICPMKAIEIISDSEGFTYPKVNKSKCVNCGICINNCAFYNEKREKNKAIEGVYIVKHKEDSVRLNSRSGGAFVACSDWILKNNGVVYGAVLDNNMNTVHARAENITERNKICKSKYVQSDMNNIIEKVKDDLEGNRYVLFSGTGCQVDAIIKYLKNKKVDTKKLYAMDIICHGVASPIVFKDYIKWLEKKYKSKVTYFEFRDKKIGGWGSHIESAIINEKKIKLSYFREIFHTDLCIRPACYNCKYTKVKRNSDITIGDAWGIKQNNPNFDDNKGVSIVIAQSKKGNELIKAVKESFELKEVNIDNYMQPNLIKPSEPKGKREEFWNVYKKEKINGIIKKYGTVPIYRKLGAEVKYKIKKIKYGRKIYLP